MPEPSTLALFVPVALLFAASPGPNFVYVLARSVSGGQREGLLSVLGIGTGALIHTLAAVLGLSALLMTSALAFSAIKYAGAAYLVYLGVRTLLSRDELSEKPGAPEGKAYTQGLVTMLLNPKAALYYFAFLPQFIDVTKSAAGQLLTFGLIQTLAAVVVYASLALLAGSLSRSLQRRRGFRRSQRWLTGCTYIALGAGVAFSGKR